MELQSICYVKHRIEKKELNEKLGEREIKHESRNEAIKEYWNNSYWTVE